MPCTFDGMCAPIVPCTILEMPKSATTQWSNSSMRKLGGLRSCEMMLCSCSSDTALQISPPYRLPSRGPRPASALPRAPAAAPRLESALALHWPEAT